MVMDIINMSTGKVFEGDVASMPVYKKEYDGQGRSFIYVEVLMRLSVVGVY